eukprot:TRINITY_DN16003_c0_g1_i1.p1 TRINITY_DN16003_c0_g1~~TRINITY_DN16003_c0_g1_i1.p1  ORF type:complete len:193 (+),score=44.96 TRINITY_DN16003_c0_g1_i1:53-631(+)
MSQEAEIDGPVFERKGRKFQIVEVVGEKMPSQLEKYVRPLFREYVRFLGIDLDFQGFEEELQALPGIYAKEESGAIIVALEFVDGKDPIAAGVVALKSLEPGISEMKRLYVRDDYRGCGLGKSLMLLIINRAQQLGYRVIRWDTLARLTDAGKLYDQFNAKQIAPYNYNPFDDVMYFELDLSSPFLKSAETK